MIKAPFKVIGHRGACGYVPENTIESFEKAIDLGVRVVEFDVHFSLDGIPMVIHDATVNRTTTLRGRVSRFTAAQMKAAIGKGGRGVPELSDVLSLLDRAGVAAYVELKGGPPGCLPKLLSLIDPSRPDRMLSSFNHKWLQEARSLSPELRIQALFSRPPICKPLWLDALGPLEVGVDFQSLSPASAKRMINWGYPLLTYTVNEDEDMCLAREMGLAGMFSDFPDRFLAKH